MASTSASTSTSTPASTPACIKIYYSASVRGGLFSKDIMRRHFAIMKKNNCSIMTEHIGSDSAIKEEEYLSDTDIYDRDMGFIINCDIFIADVTVPSLGVGFTISQAANLHKPVLCLCYTEDLAKPPKISAMISGCKGVILRYYTDDKSYESCLIEFLTDTGCISLQSSQLSTVIIKSMANEKKVLPSSIYDKDHNIGGPRIFLTGPPGSGKSSVGKNLESRYGMIFISTGQLLRDLCRESPDSKLAQKIKSLMDRGELVPADIMRDIVINKLLSEKCKNKGYVLDGYPPSYNDLLNLNEYSIIPDLVLNFECSDDTAISRQCGRGERSTDNEDSARERLKVYHSEIPKADKLYEWYPSTPIISINAEESQLDVLRYVCTLIERYFTTSRISSYSPIPVYNMDNLKSTKFHFHIDGENQASLKQILHNLFVFRKDVQQQVKIYPIEKLCLGPQTKTMAVYSHMMNFHEIKDGDDLDEAFVTGRFGNEFDVNLMLNVLIAAVNHKSRFGERCMVEIEQYVYEFTYDSHVFSFTMVDEPIEIDMSALAEFNGNLARDIPTTELHLGFDLAKAEYSHMPISLEDLMTKCTENGLDNGGWFIFADPNVWKYRTNEFTNLDLTSCKDKLLLQTKALENILQGYNIQTSISGSIEMVHGIWQF